MAELIPARRKIIYAISAVIIFFSAMELILRVYDFPFYFNFSADILGMPLLDMCRFRRIANKTVDFDPDVFWRFKPGQILSAKGVYRKPVRINNFGFRGKDFSIEKRPGSFRILCLGDSVTFGWSVGDEETYPAQMERLLRGKYPGKDIEVINLGVTGYTSFQGRQLFFKFGERLKPDIVIFGFGQNDRLPALSSDEELFKSKAWQKSKLDLVLSHSQIYKLLKAGVIYLERRIQGLSLNPESFLPHLKRKVNQEEYKNNFVEVKKECDLIGCKMILLNVDFPSLGLDPATESLQKMSEETQARFPANWREWNSLELNREISAQSGIVMIDLRELFVKNSSADKNLMIDNGHPNEIGHRLIAEALLRVISEEIFSGE